MKIGLYFGSFNPVHHGHLIIASFVADNTDCDQVWFVVTPQNPLKKQSSLLNEANRKQLIDLAIEQDNRLRSSNVEFKLPRPSFTIDTLTHLSETYPKHKFKIIIGSDAFSNIKKWKNWEILIRDYGFFIYERPGYPLNPTMLSPSIKKLDAPLLEISSSMIRDMLKSQQMIRYYVPDVVLQEIAARQYYV